MIKNNESLKFYQQNLFKKQIDYLMNYNTMLFFIRKTYSLAVLAELFNIKYKLWMHLNSKLLFSIIIKSLIFHKV
jgi:hypothetical protein